MRLALISSLALSLAVGCGHAQNDDDDDDENDAGLEYPGTSNPGTMAPPGSEGTNNDTQNEGDGRLGPTDTGEDEECHGESNATDYTGDYVVELIDITGCDEESFWLEGWASGSMTISEMDDGLHFNFLSSDAMAFGGAVDSDGNHTFDGSVLFFANVDMGETGLTTRMARLDVEQAGTFSREGDCWVLDGRFTVLVDEDDNGLEFDNCTLGAAVKANQVAGGLCGATKSPGEANSAAGGPGAGAGSGPPQQPPGQ